MKKTDWKTKLIYKETKAGDVLLPIAANVCTILANDPAWYGIIAFDAFLETVVLVGAAPWGDIEAPAKANAGEWTDADSARAVNWLSRHHELHTSTKILDQCVPVVAARKVVHPVTNWLDGLAHDGTPRLDRLFVDYFGAEDTDYIRGVGARFGIGAVARVKQPGAKVDVTPVLEGPQGSGKSTAVRKLAGDDWFFDTPITMGDVDSYQALRGKWIGELGELHSLGKSDLNRAKNFLTAVSDHYRPSYGRRTQTHPRQIVFVGTTNSTEYLRDESGNRRFWPVRCGTIDLAAIERDRAQIWAEALARYSAGEAWHVDTSEFARLCAVEQDERFVEDAWQPVISEWVMSAGHTDRRANGVTTGEVLKGALAMAADSWPKAEQDRVAGILRRLGWERGRQQRVAGEVVRRWKPKAVTLVTVASDAPVTGESGSQTLLSPVSPANVITHLRNADPGNTLRGIQCDSGDAGDVVTAGFGDWLKTEGMGGRMSPELRPDATTRKCDEAFSGQPILEALPIATTLARGTALPCAVGDTVRAQLGADAKHTACQREITPSAEGCGARKGDNLGIRSQKADQTRGYTPVTPAPRVNSAFRPVASCGKQAVQLATVAPAKKPPGKASEDNRHDGGLLPVRQEERLRAIDRAPELARHAGAATLAARLVGDVAAVRAKPPSLRSTARRSALVYGSERGARGLSPVRFGKTPPCPLPGAATAKRMSMPPTTMTGGISESLEIAIVGASIPLMKVALWGGPAIRQFSPASPTTPQPKEHPNAQ